MERRRARRRLDLMTSLMTNRRTDGGHSGEFRESFDVKR
jgi:hypothetical protein